MFILSWMHYGVNNLYSFAGSIQSGKKECKVLTGQKSKGKGQKKTKGHLLCLALTTDSKFLVLMLLSEIFISIHICML